MPLVAKIPELREWWINRTKCRYAGFVYNHERIKNGKLLVGAYTRLSPGKDYYLISTTLGEEYILMKADYKGELK